MSFFSQNSRFLVLSAVAFLYFGAQWLGASKMGGCQIFSSVRGTDRADFAMLVHQVSAAALVYCASRRPRKLLFEDGDVVTPYLEGIADPLGQCQVVRITPVTLFTPDELENCGNLFVKDFAPPQFPRFEQGFATDPILPAFPWPVVDRWVSEDGRYGFAMYRHPCPTPEDRNG